MTGRRRSAIDRRLPVAAMGLETSVSALSTDTIVFVDAWGKPDQRFDPGQLSGLPADLRRLLVDAFREYGTGQQRPRVERPGELPVALLASSATTA